MTDEEKQLLDELVAADIDWVRASDEMEFARSKREEALNALVTFRARQYRSKEYNQE
jgi:hypothetical protein